jgi:aminopeptidase N
MQNGWQEGMVSHEFSHQWFGDLITCGTWADVWLNESFGTYCEALWLENTTGYSAYKTHLNAQANSYLMNNPGWPIYNPDWAINTPSINQLYNTAIIYYKGACVLHQLRYVLGDSLFFNVMHSYPTDTTLMYKNAVTGDFISVVNQVSGQDLAWFFTEWIYHPNHPIYENTYEIDDLGAGNWKVKLVIEQTQTNTMFFKMPVEIQIDFEDGSDTLAKVMNDTNFQIFEFTFNRKPIDLLFDPQRNILLKHATTVVGIKGINKESGFELKQNEPNPFKESTHIKYSIPQSSQVKISVLDSFGHILFIPLNKEQERGSYDLLFSNEIYAPGVYYYKMEAGNFIQTKKMIILDK